MSFQDLPDSIRIVSDEDRSDFLPDSIGFELVEKFPLFQHYENAVYALAKNLIEQYAEKSGYWVFAKTENNLPFLFFTSDKVTINNIYGDNPVELYGCLAGLSISAQAYLLLLERFKGKLSDDKHDNFIDRYHDLINEGRNIAKQLQQTQQFYNHVD